MSELDKEMLISVLADRPGRDKDKELLLRELLSDALSSKRKQSTPDELKRLYDIYKVKHDFKEGDIVCWKEGMKDRKLPKEGEPAVVVRKLEKQVFDVTQEGGSQYFNEPFDIVLGLIDSDGDFATYHFNSQKFEPYK